MSRIPAKRSRKMFAPIMASPVTMPRYSLMRLPSMFGVVVTIISLSAYGNGARMFRGRSSIGRASPWADGIDAEMAVLEQHGQVGRAPILFNGRLVFVPGALLRVDQERCPADIVDPPRYGQ